MLRQIKILTALELRNLFGINTFRFNKDKKAKQKTGWMMVAYLFVLAVMCFYVGGLSYGLILLELGDVVPAYLFTIASLVIFFFGIFKAGSVIFAKGGLDMLCALPIKQTAIVISRFVRMYVENLAVTLAVLVPGFAVCAILLRPGLSFYLLGTLGMFFTPLIPLAAATLIGALVTAVSSRMKHKGLVSSGLSVLILLGIMLGSNQMTVMEGDITPEMMQHLSDIVLPLLERLYPPAVWLGSAVSYGDWVKAILCIALSLGIFGAVTALVSVRFRAICQRLYSTSAKHNYRMQNLKKNTVLTSLCKREFKRYFSSGIYVSNTIIGPIMGMVLAGSLLFVDPVQFTGQLPFAVELWALVPFVVTATFCLMTTSSVALSMEGKNWWIAKSLPLSLKAILDAKILMNLLLILPFYLISEALLMFALRPAPWEMLWILLVPAVFILFCSVFGIVINLHFPKFDWDNDVTVVKQSASAMIGGMGGSLITMLCALPVLLVSGAYVHLALAVICTLILGLTVLLYRHSCTVKL